MEIIFLDVRPFSRKRFFLEKLNLKDKIRGFFNESVMAMVITHGVKFAARAVSKCYNHPSE
jgi:hypothetical protein